MKTFLLGFLILLTAPAAFGQWYWGFSFEYRWGNYNANQLVRDTVSNPLCSWQIGTPQKVIFDSAYQSERAILTDTANPVRPNDTSVFILKHARDSNNPFHFFALQFWHKMDGDSMDFGRMEVSRDTGHTWANILTEDTTYGFQWGWNTQKPTLRGSTNGWEFVRVEMVRWANGPNNSYADTILFRFTYITDSGTVPHDGWMIDDIRLEDWWEGVENVGRDTLISVYPNPVSDRVFVKRQDGKVEPVTIQVFDVSGRKVFEDKALSSACTIDTRGFEAGLYYLRYVNKEGAVTKKFVVRH